MTTPILDPDSRAFLERYKTWPAWRRWLWRQDVRARVRDWLGKPDA